MSYNEWGVTWDSMTFQYPTGPVVVTAKSWAGLVCDGCGGPKSRNTGRCWKCAGQPEPRHRGEPEHRMRVYNALARNHPTRETDEAALFRWAATLPDSRILEMRNIGLGALAWLRAHQPEAVEFVPRTVTVACPMCHGTGTIVASVVAQGPETG